MLLLCSYCLYRVTVASSVFREDSAAELGSMFMAIPLIAKPSVYYAGAVDTPLAIDEYFSFNPNAIIAQ